jgi:low temperature requirement protein LtrA
MSNSLWRPPILHTKHTEIFGHDRKVAWLELFYDLVYVATLIQLGNSLSEDISWSGFLKFAALFIPIWWSWTGITFYFNRFVVDDIWHRVLIFTQILFIAILGISVEGAFTDLTAQFVLSYVGIRAVLIILYLRAGRHEPEARPLINRFVAGFSLAAFVWLISIFVPAPYNYGLWVLAMIIDFATPTNPNSAKFFDLLPPHNEHLQERYGLLVIIVLGESFVKIISSGSGLSITAQILIFSVFGLILTYSLWWHYFQDIVAAEIRSKGMFAWIYTHLPLTLSLIAYGVAAKKLFLAAPGGHVDDKYRLMMGAMVALYLVCIAILNWATERHGETNNRTRIIYRLAAAVLVLALAFFGAGLPPILFVALVGLIVIIPIAIDVQTTTRSEEQPQH